MLFNLSKIITAFILVASAAAMPSKRNDLVTCDLVLKPDVFVDSTTVNLLAEFNYSIGRTLAMAVPGSTINGPTGAIWLENTDNTFNVQDTLSASGLTSAQTGAIITGWTGTTLTGIAANWLVESATCA